VRVPELLAELTSGGIHLSTDGDRLRCNAPTGVLTPELRDRLVQGKSEILEFLRSAEKLAKTPRSIVPLQPLGQRIPVFAVAGHNGDVFCYRALARRLGSDLPFFGLQPPGLDGQSEPLARIEELAACFAAQIRSFRPAGSCVIAGFCAGGSIAFELARQLLQEGVEVRFLALFGCPFPSAYRLLPRMRKLFSDKVKSVLERAEALVPAALKTKRAGISEQVPKATAQRPDPPVGPDQVLLLRAKVQRATLAAARRYKPGYFAGRVIHFMPCKEWVRCGFEPLRWRSVALQAQDLYGPDGCPSAFMLREPNVSEFANLFSQSYENLAEPKFAGPS
jgi:thioesterase domain-containing protein